MNDYLLVFLAGFTSVFMLGFQSRNVNSGHYVAAAVTSFVIALAQAKIWILITKPGSGWDTAVVYGVSGVVGITLAMYVHQRFMPKKG